jgi:hypothetical protein
MKDSPIYYVGSYFFTVYLYSVYSYTADERRQVI